MKCLCGKTILPDSPLPLCPQCLDRHNWRVAHPFKCVCPKCDAVFRSANPSGFCKRCKIQVKGVKNHG